MLLNLRQRLLKLTNPIANPLLLFNCTREWNRKITNICLSYIGVLSTACCNATPSVTTRLKCVQNKKRKRLGTRH